MSTSRIKLPSLFRRWRKAEWPRSTGPHDPLRGEEIPSAEHAAERQEWEEEGGAVAQTVPGPKTPL